MYSLFLEYAVCSQQREYNKLISWCNNWLLVGGRAIVEKNKGIGEVYFWRAIQGE